MVAPNKDGAVAWQQSGELLRSDAIARDVTPAVGPDSKHCGKGGRYTREDGSRGRECSTDRGEGGRVGGIG